MNNECIIVTDEDLEITLRAISEAMEGQENASSNDQHTAQMGIRDYKRA